MAPAILDPLSILLLVSSRSWKEETPTEEHQQHQGKWLLCEFLSNPRLRQEIQEALNVIEQWNSVNGFIFSARGGELLSNRPEDQEMAVSRTAILAEAISMHEVVLYLDSYITIFIYLFYGDIIHPRKGFYEISSTNLPTRPFVEAVSSNC